MLGAVGADFRVALDPSEIADGGDWVAVVVHGTFTSRRTGRSMPVDCVDIYRLRGGKITRVDVYYKEPGALAELCTESTESDSRGERHAVPIPPSSRDRGEFR
jgi:ketosteroid isomerase-like protein